VLTADSTVDESAEVSVHVIGDMVFQVKDASETGWKILTVLMGERYSI